MANYNAIPGTRLIEDMLSQIIHYERDPNLPISAACERVLNGTQLLKDRGEIQDVEQYLAPPDLWNRSQETGKSRAIIFAENGLFLTKVNNDIAAGCTAMKELLIHGEGQKSKLTILNNSAPNLLMCLKKVQTDAKKPNMYAKDPHDLTHDLDALRYYSVYWTHGAQNPTEKRRMKWRKDQWEDYRNASVEDKKYLQLPEDTSCLEAANYAQALRAIRGDTKALEYIRDTLGEKPTDKISAEVTALTPEDKELLERVSKRLEAE